jgi:hypothetical protein
VWVLCHAGLLVEVFYTWHGSWQSMDVHAQVTGMLWFKAKRTRRHGGLGLSREEGTGPLRGLRGRRASFTMVLRCTGGF